MYTRCVITMRPDQLNIVTNKHAVSKRMIVPGYISMLNAPLPGAWTRLAFRSFSSE